MRAVVQRVASATVETAGEVVGSIGPGLCVFVGVGHDDDEAASDRLADKLWHLRVFEDGDGRMNRAASELDRELLVVSQFTLCADTSRGRRPSFTTAADPDKAERLYERVVAALVRRGARVATGRFGAEMAVSLTNDGPVTLVLDV